MLGTNCKDASVRNNPPGRMWISVSTICRANPVSRAAAGEAGAPKRPGQNRTSVRRVTAATPITIKKMTALQRRRLARLETGIEFPHLNFPPRRSSLAQRTRRLRAFDRRVHEEGPLGAPRKANRYCLNIIHTV